MNTFWKIILFSTLVTISGCRKFVEVPNPSTQIVTSAVFSNDATATAAMLGIYSTMEQDLGMASVNTSLFAGLSADELISYSTDAGLDQFYTNSLNPANPNMTNYWGNAYQYIYGANGILEGLTNNSTISQTVKQQLTGEAKFVRAFCYFYLVNLFGDVPLILSTDYSKNALASRSQMQLVYNQITSDLLDAQNELPENYVQANNTATSQRLRPNKWAAAALLARVYLYQGDWTDAVTQSTNVINQSGVYQLAANLDSVFLAGSNEAILQLYPVDVNVNATWDGFIFVLSDAPSGLYGVSLNAQLASDFEAGDQRKLHWVDSVQALGVTYYYPYKYKISSATEVTEYEMVLRLSEQYLIRSEANAMLNNLSAAANDLNIIRNRAGLLNATASDQASLLQAIQNERRFELFSEWGHRWLDLKRTGMATTVLAPLKPGWVATDTLYPIPQNDRTNDPNLSQNPNY